MFYNIFANIMIPYNNNLFNYVGDYYAVRIECKPVYKYIVNESIVRLLSSTTYFKALAIKTSVPSILIVYFNRIMLIHYT